LTRREAGLTTLDKLLQASGVRLGAQSVGHSNYNVGRIMAWVLGLQRNQGCHRLFESGAEGRFDAR